MTTEISGEDIYSAESDVANVSLSDVASDTVTEEIPRSDMSLSYTTERPMISCVNLRENGTFKLQHSQINGINPGPPLLGPVSVNDHGTVQIMIHNQSTNHNTSSSLMLVPPTSGAQSPAAMMRILNKDLPLRARTNISENEDILYQQYTPYATINDERVEDMVLQIAAKLQFVDRILAGFFTSIIAEDNKTYIQKQLVNIRQRIASKTNNGSQPRRSDNQTVNQDDATLGDLGHFCQDLFDYSTATEPRDENAQAPEFRSTHGDNSQILHYIQDALEVPYWNFILRDLYRWHTGASILSGDIIMTTLRHVRLYLQISVAKLKGEIKVPDLDGISPLIKGIEARIRLLKSVRDTSTKDGVEECVYDFINPNRDAQSSTSALLERESTLSAEKGTMLNDSSQDTVLSMVAVFIFIALAIGAFSVGFAMALKNGGVGSATDADFWFLLQGNIMWTLGSIMMIVPLFRGSWFAPAYLSMWIFLVAGLLCNVASVVIYIQVNTGWSNMLAFFGSIASAAAVLVMTQGTMKPEQKRKLKSD